MYITILILVFGLEAFVSQPLFLVIDGAFSQRQESVYARRKTFNRKPSSTMQKSHKKRKRTEPLAQEVNSSEPIFSERTEVTSATDTSSGREFAVSASFARPPEKEQMFKCQDCDSGFPYYSCLGYIWDNSKDFLRQLTLMPPRREISLEKSHLSH